MTVSEIALELRAAMQKWKPGNTVATLKWLKQRNDAGERVQDAYDKDGLTFVVSAWIFQQLTWEDVDFKAKPAFFEQKNYTPFVCLCTTRPGLDGLNIWFSGQQETLATLVKEVNRAD